MKNKIKQTKNTITFNGYYSIARSDVDRDGLIDWVKHLSMKKWVDVSLIQTFCNWYNVNN